MSIVVGVYATPDAEAFRCRFHGFYLLLNVFVVLKLGQQPSLFLCLVGSVVTGVAGGTTGFYLDDAGNGFIEKIAVMRDNERSAGVLGQKAFQPLN